MEALSVIWNVSPYIYQITETYGLRWYGVLFALAFVSSYYISLYIFKKENRSEHLLDVLFIVAAVFGVLGARIGHCLFYEPQYYFHNPGKILRMWEGGLASHGGAFGILISFAVVSHIMHVPYKTILARALLVIPLAGVFFRVGNLMNSEIYGVPTSLPWGFIFLQSSEVLAGIEVAEPRHPTQIYEALGYAFVFCIMMWHCHKRFIVQKTPSDDFIIGIFGFILFLIRFLVEFIKAPQETFEEGMFLNMGQLLSLPFIMYGLYSLFLYRKKSKV